MYILASVSGTRDSILAPISVTIGTAYLHQLASLGTAYLHQLANPVSKLRSYIEGAAHTPKFHKFSSS